MKIKTWLIGLAVASGILLAAIGCHEKQQKGTSRDFDTINTGTGPNTGTGMTLLQQAQLLNDLILVLNSHGIDLLRLAGADSLVINTSAATNVTLPTSGTLIGSATYHPDNLTVSGTTVYGLEGGDSLYYWQPMDMRDDAASLFPTIQSAAGDTSNYNTPDKIGDLYVDTSAGKVYVSVSSARGGWRILNWMLPLFIVWNVKRRRRK